MSTVGGVSMTSVLSGTERQHVRDAIGDVTTLLAQSLFDLGRAEAMIAGGDVGGAVAVIQGVLADTACQRTELGRVLEIVTPGALANVVPAGHRVGFKVFSATKGHDRDTLGDRVTAWLGQMQHTPGFHVLENTIKQSSDSEFHCLTIIIRYRERVEVRRAA